MLQESLVTIGGEEKTRGNGNLKGLLLSWVKSVRLGMQRGSFSASL